MPPRKKNVAVPFKVDGVSCLQTTMPTSTPLITAGSDVVPNPGRANFRLNVLPSAPSREDQVRSHFKRPAILQAAQSQGADFSAPTAAASADADTNGDATGSSCMSGGGSGQAASSDAQRMSGAGSSTSDASSRPVPLYL